MGPGLVLSPVHLAGFIPAAVLHVRAGVPAFVLRETQESVIEDAGPREDSRELGSRTLLSSRSSACIQMGLLSSVQTRRQS